MSIITENRASAAFSRAYDTAADRIGEWIHRVGQRFATNRNRRELYALPDHILKDIAISRGDILYLTQEHATDMDADPRLRERNRGARRGRRRV